MDLKDLKIQDVKDVKEFKDVEKGWRMDHTWIPKKDLWGRKQ